eukprot:2384486-Prymnesium_polylepis.1
MVRVCACAGRGGFGACVRIAREGRVRGERRVRARRACEVSISVQIEPPMVTWPVRKTNRGRMTRTYGGRAG